ncbi:methyl-accepting chemotaxis protein [Roseateles sp. DXS20W]|uniref:Methyl-accepting chemotaxis protein n=1 Tax=Pelomonas lactea TaxID=3299030 RepID=A0ABW7GJA2_9BURK
MERLSIKTRLLLVFGLLAASTLLVAALSAQALHAAQQRLDGFVHGLSRRAEVANAFRAAVDQRALAVRNMVVTPDQQHVMAYGADAELAHGTVAKRLKELEALAGPQSDASSKARELIAQLRKLEDQYGPVAVDIVADLKAGRREIGAAKLVERCQPLLAALQAGSQEYQQYTRERSVERLDQALETTHHGYVVLLAGSAVALVAAIAAAVAVTRSIVIPINHAVSLAEAVADGDLTVRLTTSGDDEVAHLLRTLGAMNGKLGEIVRTVREGSDCIASGTGQIAAGNADLSSRTEIQAGALQETAATMRELSDMVQRNAEHAASAQALTSEASTHVMNSDQAVRRVSVVMASIRSSSERVMAITDVINGIAFQTNLLALNAAVEAARAGEQGRGFAVVAAEVRALATRSADAAKQISSLINESAENVRHGVVEVDQAGGAMQTVVKSIDRVRDLVSDIAAESRNQSQGVSRVGAAVSSIDDATQRNAALVEESAAASQSLSTQAQRLAEVVSRFRVPASA